MVIFETLIEALETHAVDDRTVTLIEAKDTEVVLSFKQLHQQALLLLANFQAKGIKPGDHLVIFLRNNEQFLYAFWAAVLGGIIPVPVAVGISDEHRSKLFKIFNKLESAYIFTDSDNLERLRKYADENQFTDDYRELSNKSCLIESIIFAQLSVGDAVVHRAKADDICFIQFSSGSTSDPKGVVLTHKNLILNVLAKAEAGGYTKDDISLSWMPLTHDMGLIGFHINMIVCYMQHCIMATELFSRRPLLWLDKVSEKKATVICSPNFGYKHYLKALKNKTVGDLDLSSVRVILNGAEPISTKLCDEFNEAMQPYGLKSTAMLPVYGLAEATLAVSFPRWGKDYRTVYIDRQQIKIGEKVSYVDSDSAHSVAFPVVGFAVPDMQIRIADKAGNVFSEDTTGSIQIKGPTVTQGYYLDVAATEAVMTDGWLDTGDIGLINQGELVITGRSKEIIFAHGQNYYPHDLESILIHHAECELGKVAAYGVRDDDRQRDELLVFVIYRADMDDFLPVSKRITKTLNEMAGLEVDYVIPVQRIPKTTSGKFQRGLLAAAYEAGEYQQLIGQLYGVEQIVATGDDSSKPLEKELVELSIAVLDDRQLTVDDNFFEVGISSLSLAEFHQKIDDRYPDKIDKIDIVDFFEHQSIKAIAAFMLSK